VLEYHIKGQKSTDATIRMFNSYGLSGSPSVVINGRRENPMYGPRTTSQYTSEITKFLGSTSTVMMEASLTTVARMTVSVELTNLSTEALQNARLYAVVYEDTGTKHNHYLVKDIAQSDHFTLSGRSTASFEIATSIQDSSARHMVIMCKSNTGTILQSMLVK